MMPTPAPPAEFRRAAAIRWVVRAGPMATVILLLCLGFHHAALVLFCIAFCAIAYVNLSPTTRLLGPVTVRLPDSEGVLITLDDGPHPGSTLAMLDVLDQHQAKALFFVIGDRAHQWPDLVREIVRRGHTVGNHSQTHPSGRFWSLGARGTWREIADCQATLAAILGQVPTWFRAPVGHFNFFTHPALKAQSLRLMSWSARGFDTVDASVPRVLRRIEPNLKAGAIALVHEALPYSADLLEGLLAMIRDKGLPFVDPAGVK